MAGAAPLIRESLTLRQEIGDTWGVAGCVEGLGWVSALEAAPARAAYLFGATESLRESVGPAHLPGLRASYEPAVAAAQAQLDDSAFAAARAEGRAMTLEQAVAYALDEQPPA